jgi:hypothetical protein
MSAFRGTAGEACDMPRTPLVTRNDQCCYLSVQEMVQLFFNAPWRGDGSFP